jgi:hypothetical protein
MELKLASQLTADERKAIWDIEEANMRDLCGFPVLLFLANLG